MILILRAKFNAKKKDLSVHLVFQFKRKSDDVTLIKLTMLDISAKIFKSTLIIKLKQKMHERNDLHELVELRIKILMSVLICRDLKYNNKKS